MSGHLTILAAGHGVTVQDLGRPGHLARGLSRGGAADRLALAEGAALLGQPAGLAALEMAGFGVTLETDRPMRFALSGAPMQAAIDGATIAWNASHALHPGQRLAIGAVSRGSYGYFLPAGGIDLPPFLGSRAAHLTAGIGDRIAEGQRLPLGPDPNPGSAPRKLHALDRFRGGSVRITASAQTGLFGPTEIARFAATDFRRDPRGNRQGVRLAHEGAPFAARGQLSILSEVIVPGDIQMTGDGVPFVLLPECQATGGYPRIGTVLPADLPIVAQAEPGAPLAFRFVPLEEALAAEAQARAELAALPARTEALIRDPRDIADLLGYQLISGATAGKD